VVLDDSNILQDDATVIAGLLILIGIFYSLLPRGSGEVGQDIARLAASKISNVTIIIVIPFAASAILVILGNISQISQIVRPLLPGLQIVPPLLPLLPVLMGTTSGMLVNFGKYAMILGFGTLAVGIIWHTKSMTDYLNRVDRARGRI
jgi:hypothetical protein